MQIKSIILYSRSGKSRVLSFQIGKVNVITGKSKTGKSAIIDIVDYCLGRSKFLIPEGIIRENVSWYAVIFQLQNMQILVAKPSPKGSKVSQSQAYFQSGQDIEIPEFSKLKLNSNDDAVISNISDFLGISANINTPSLNESRNSLSATVRHGSFYLYQDQNTISNRSYLFHRQQEDFQPQTIKDTLPYFLGAGNEDQLILEQQLKRATRDLKLAQRQLNEAESIVSNQSYKVSSLFAEAQQVGLLDSAIIAESIEEMFDILSRCLSWEPEEIDLALDDQVPQLQSEIGDLYQEFKHLQEKVASTETFVKQAEGYSSEAQHQLMRLESIHLFKERTGDIEFCPLCGSDLQDDLPPNIAAIQHSLESLQADVHIVEGKQPKVRKFVEQLKSQRDEIRYSIREKQAIINSIQEEQEVARRLRDINARRYRVLGRISLFLETIDLTDETSELRQQVERCQNEVARLEAELDPINADDVLQSILNRLGQQMTIWANSLDLEHQESPYRFDLKNLTVIADRSERPIPMIRMGSGENWLGCHLVSHLALHKHFIEKQRPVPSFLILDQPCQVYFPSKESYLSLEGQITQEIEGANADIQAVNNMFELLFKVCEELSPHFQIIVLEHANLETDSFQSALIEEPWTGERALIPTEFL